MRVLIAWVCWPASASTSAGLDFASPRQLLIDSDGGRVDLIATAWTTYSLIVPAGRVCVADPDHDDAPASLAGSPLGGGLVGGVELEPDGLELAKTATS